MLELWGCSFEVRLIIRLLQMHPRGYNDPNIDVLGPKYYTYMMASVGPCAIILG